MREFGKFHPTVNFIYFAAVIGFSMILMNPVCLALSFCCGFAYSVMLGGRRAALTDLAVLAPVIVISAVFNVAFSHEGVTILAYLPGGNPLTLESALYGAAAAVMLASVFFWFSCFNRIMTSDKLMYLFGGVVPSLSLTLSMSLRLVPRFTAKARKIFDAQRGIGRSSGGIISKMRGAAATVSALLTWALEDAVETADSMRGRGFGTAKRTSFSLYKTDTRDIFAIVYLAALIIYILVGKISGGLSFLYFPAVTPIGRGAYEISLYAAFAFLAAMPIIIEVWEEIRWKHIQSAI